VLVDRQNLPRHLPWIVFTASIALLATIWFFVEVARIGGRPSGSSVPGLVFGSLAGLIILFEFLLWPRKALLRAWRIGRTEAWLRAHIWLGLLSLPLAVYHCGFRMGGSFSTVLMIVFLLVIASGIVGLLLQQTLPSKMLVEVRAETIYSQIEHVLAQLRDEADRLVEAVCGKAVITEGSRLESLSISSDTPLVVGSIGRVGGVQGRFLQTIVPTAPVPGSEVVHEFYQNTVRPYLLDRSDPGSPLQSSDRAIAVFQNLRAKLGPDTIPAVQALESLCEQRRQLDKQARMHFWLHSWLWIHLPLSAALLFLLIVHVWVAVRYW
jgi:hypothetical protein